MARYAGVSGPHNPDATCVARKYPEQLFDTGEVQLAWMSAYAKPGQVIGPMFALWSKYLGDQRSIARRLKHARRYRLGSSTLRQVTHPSSFSNSLMSTTTGEKPTSLSSSAVRGAEAAISTRSAPRGTT